MELQFAEWPISMTDNPLLSAHRQIEDMDAALRPKSWPNSWAGCRQG
jgi:hypothetical protein